MLIALVLKKGQFKLHYIGKLDRTKIGKYANKIVTEDVVLTDERKNHIYDEHKKDYKLIMKNLDRIVLNPDNILEDKKRKDTLLYIGKIENDNLNIVIKLNTTNSTEHPQNSVMTAWIIRDSNVEKLMKKSKKIYKKE
jgi:hypothetical protein